MKLENLSRKNSYIHLERWVNQPKYSVTAQYSEVSKRYHPRLGEPHFELPYFFINRQHIELFLAQPDAVLYKKLITKRQVRFFCHPDSLEEFKNDQDFLKSAGQMKVSPTSSTRTVLTRQESTNFMVKLHLNRRVSRFIRRLSRDSIIHSVQISRELEELTKQPDCPKEFAYLPESIGVSHKKIGAGFLIRESTARPCVTNGKRYLLPFFSLYSRDNKSPDDPPILTQLLSRLSRSNKKRPLDIFMSKIMEPFIKSWTYAFLSRGLLLEAHGQNTLLEIDDQFRPCRIVQRDFQSTPVDPEIRQKNSLALPFKKHIIGQGDYPRLIEHSLLYDHFVGDYLFKSLANYFEEEYHLDPSEFSARTKKLFRKYLPGSSEKIFFPQGHVTFGDKTSNNISPLIYYHDRPLFRPGY